MLLNINVTVTKDINYKNFDDLFEKYIEKKLEANTQNIFVSGGLDSTNPDKLLNTQGIL